MESERNYPKLRWPIELRMEHVEQGEVLVMSCPLGITASPLALVGAVAPIIACFDGSQSIEQISGKFSQYGVSVELIEQLVTILDDNLFLHGARFFDAEKSFKETFLAAPKRPAALAGLAYPLEPQSLVQLVDGYLRAPGTNGHSTPRSGRLHGEMLALMAPHIDYRRGGEAYGSAYRRLRGESHDLYVLIGTAHQYSRHMFHLTKKDFLSPLGELACDKEFVSKLAGLYGAQRSFADELLHRKEHSLELQTPFLKRLKPTAKIVPILVGSFHHMLSAGSPAGFDEYGSFAGSLAECVSAALSHGKKVCFVAGVDMAHIGRAFGDPGSLSDEIMRKIEERDRLYLRAIECQDKEALFAHVAEDSDQRRICGFPSMYTLLDVLDRLRLRCSSELFQYKQAVDYTTDCAVTFAGMGLYRAGDSAP